MIRTLLFKFGSSASAENLQVDVAPVTVFVGPNNSGKSKVLQEINRYCVQGDKNARDVVVEKIEYESFTDQNAESALDKISLKPTPTETVGPDNVVVGRYGSRQNVQRARLKSAILNPESEPIVFSQWFLAFNTLILNGANRINLVGQQSAGDLQQPPASSFQLLSQDDVLRNEVRRILLDAFGLHFVIDPTNLGQLRIRLADRAPVSAAEEQGIDSTAVAFHGSAQLIDQASDGVKAFTGMITEIIAGDPYVLLIDEPEAFLHPALAFKLAFEIASTRVTSNKRIFVSTHSSDFVRGCIQSDSPVNVIRLTYRRGVPTARLLPNQDILNLMRNPLLRSAGVINALFYEYVIVTESDADRAFYEEVNDRLLRFSEKRGIPNCLFLNAQNKQTIHQIVRPLRALGIPVAGIVDIDILKEGGTVWGSFLKAAGIPELEMTSLSSSRRAIKSRFAELGIDMKRNGGVMQLEASDREAVENLFKRLAEYGMFVVPTGELESWLNELGCTGHGPTWLIKVFEKMGEDPSDPAYIKPEDGDVWQFINRTRDWLSDPSRLGIPS